MKKISLIIYMLFIMIVILAPGRVDGIETCDSDYEYACSSCVYKGHFTNVTFRLYAREDENGNIYISDTLSKPDTISNYNIVDKSGVSSTIHYIADNKLTCPKKLYVQTTHNTVSGTSTGKNTYNFNLSFEKFKSGETQTLTRDDTDTFVNKKKLKKYSNNETTGETDSQNNKKVRVCKFTATLKDSNLVEIGKVTFGVEIENGKVKRQTQINNENYKIGLEGLTDEDFSKSCPTNLYVLCQQGSNTASNGANPGVSIVHPYCTISKDKINYSEKAEVEEVPDGDDLGGNDLIVEDGESTGPIEFGDELSEEDCEAILGDILEIVNTIFDWIKIIAPILLIVFGSIDFGSAVLQDNQDALKKAASKFVKRAIATVAIFFLPLIINLILSLPGVDSGLEEALCGISKVVIKW